MRVKKGLIAAFIILTLMFSVIMTSCGNDGEVDSTSGVSKTQEGTEDMDDEIEIKEFQKYFSNLNIDTENEIFYIEGEPLSFNERILFSSLQGIVAKTKSEFYIKYSGASTDWFNSLKTDYNITFTRVKDPYELLEKYKDKIKDSGFVTFKAVSYETYKTQDQKISESINNACTISGQESYLVVEEGLKDKLIELGFIQKENGADYTSYELFEKYKSTLNKGFLMHQRFNNFQIRDFGIAMGALFFYSYTSDTLEKIKVVHEWLDDMGVIMGWYEDEVGGVMLSSEKGNITVPSDYATNFTIYAALSIGETELLKQVDYDPKYVGNDKHYIAFMLTDGDNITYHLNNVYKDKGYNTKTERSVPVSWTFIPMAYDLAPHLAKYYYRTMTPNDNFIASLSGVGYINPGYWPKELLKTFAKTSASYMKKMDEPVVAMLIDGASKNDLLTGENPKVNSLQSISDAFSPYGSVNGGFFYFGGEYVPDSSCAGAVTWSNGKPFINLRGGTWFSGKEADRNDKLAELAYKINNRSKDATVEEGYSVMVISAGTNNAYTEDLMNLYRMLDEDVVVVTCEELVDIMTKNVAKKETRYEMTDDVKTAFHGTQLSAREYMHLKYDYLKLAGINKQAATDMLNYDFSVKSGGWEAVVTTKYKANVTSEFSVGNGFSSRTSLEPRGDYIPDVYFYNKISLPDKDSIELVANGVSNGSDIRLKVLCDNRIHLICDYTSVSSGDFEFKADLSKFKGKAVSLIYEVRNGESTTKSIKLLTN